MQYALVEGDSICSEFQLTCQTQPTHPASPTASSCRAHCSNTFFRCLCWSSLSSRRIFALSRGPSGSRRVHHSAASHRIYRCPCAHLPSWICRGPLTFCHNFCTLDLGRGVVCLCEAEKSISAWYLFEVTQQCSWANLNIYLSCCIHDPVLDFDSLSSDEIALAVIPLVILTDVRLALATDLSRDSNCWNIDCCYIWSSGGGERLWLMLGFLGRNQRNFLLICKCKFLFICEG